MSRTLNATANAIESLIRAAETSPPVTVRHPGGDPERRQVEVAPPPMAWVAIDSELIPAAQAANVTGISFGGLDPTEIGKVVPISADVARQSRFAQAGGIIIPASTPPKRLQDSHGADIWYQSAREFHVIQPAPFVVAGYDGGFGVSPQTWPVISDDDSVSDGGSISSSMPTYGCRLVLTRRQLKKLPRELWAYEISKTLSLGLANVVDRVVFGALDNALQPSAWSYGWPAAMDLHHSELSAVLGTAGVGAHVREDGVLTYGGICPAEYTSAVSSTLVGAFNRAACFIRDDLQLTAKHHGIEGGLQVDAIISLRAAVPSIDYFRKVST
jgi:hypothetical protein